jgi:hypothetical protein
MCKKQDGYAEGAACQKEKGTIVYSIVWYPEDDQRGWVLWWR